MNAGRPGSARRDPAPRGGEGAQVVLAAPAADDDGLHDVELGQGVAVHRGVHGGVNDRLPGPLRHRAPRRVTRPELVLPQRVDELGRRGRLERVRPQVDPVGVADLLADRLAGPRSGDAPGAGRAGRLAAPPASAVRRGPSDAPGSPGVAAASAAPRSRWPRPRPRRRRLPARSPGRPERRGRAGRSPGLLRPGPGHG